MSVDHIRAVLGRLQSEPESESAWMELREAITAPGGEGEGVERLLAAERASYEARREWSSVALLLELELSFVAGSPVEATMRGELARIWDEELRNGRRAEAEFAALIVLRPEDEHALERLEDLREKAEKWRKLVDRYVADAKATEEPALKSAALTRAADLTLCFGREKSGLRKASAQLAEALRVDPKNVRAAGLAEIAATSSEDWDTLAAAQATLVEHGADQPTRLSAALRLGRTESLRRRAPERAMEAFERALSIAPGNEEAIAYLTEAYAAAAEWDRLIAVYEGQLRKGGVKPHEEVGILVQIAMIQWRMKEQPEAAESSFERVRRADPQHAGMLAFFREFCTAREDKVRLATILTDAQRASKDAAERAALAGEIAKLAEAQDNAQKAIEQYKSVLRADPTNVEARQALKRLYTQTDSQNALLELYRQDLERTPSDDVPARLGLLNDMARVYRGRPKSESALVSVLIQIAQLDDKDVAPIQELVHVYEAMGRFRDVLTYQQKLAELTEDVATKAELYRAIARRWGEQFSNVQNAQSAYEALLACDASDIEAQQKLRELYQKRRAWPQLFALAERQLPSTEGSAKIDLLMEMARLCAERLDRGAQAIAIMKDVLAVEPNTPGLLDSLEKLAEREKDFTTVTDVLERRVESAPDDAARVVVLQRLGAVYADRQKDTTASTNAWRRVLELSPGHPRALRVLRETFVAMGDWIGLEELYASQNDLEGLVDFLSTSADKAPDAATKIALSTRIARVFEERIGAPMRAARSYERILSVRPGDAKSARALATIYESEEKWSRLPALYEVLISSAPGTDAAVDLLAQLVKVVGSSLADKAAAIRHARRAYDARPDERTLELLETTSLAAGTWDVFVEALEARLEKAPNLGATARRALRLKLASVHARTAAGVERAIGAYKAVIEEDPGDTETIGVLDELLRSSGRTDDIRWLFGLRAALLEGSERAALLEEWATVEDEELDDRSRAIALLEEVLAYDPERASALRVLARIQAASGQREAAVATLSVYRDLCVGQDRARREIELAMLYLDGLGRPEEAFDAAVRALDLWDSNGDATAIVERLMDGTPLRARAASVLVREYAKSGDDRREATALAAVLADERDPGARKELYLRIASIEEQRLDAAGAAFDVVLRGLGEFTSDLDFWDRASELAQKAGRSNDFAQSYRAHVLTSRPAAGVDPLVVLELCQRAVRLHDETLGDAEGSLPYLERILSLDPANGEAFRRLKLLLIGAERWEDLERLLDQVVAAASDARHQVELLNEVAVIAEDVIGDPKKAVGYYERVLEIDGEHTHSLDALERLYESAENWKSLAELLSKRIEIVSDAERADLKLRLGRLLLDKLNAPEKALDLLESVLLERSNDAEARHLVEQLVDSPRLGLRAAEILEPVYEARDEVRSLVRVLELRRKASTDCGLSVDLLRRISVLRDERLRDDAGAFASLAELLPLDPDDVSLRDRFVEIGRRLGDHEKVAGVLSAVADASGLAAVRGEILMEVARISEDLLGDAARAQAVYQRVLAIDPTDPAIVLPAARALERIHASAAEHALLAEVLELQVTLEDDGAARARLQARLATIYEEQVGATEKATRVWKARLQDEPSDVEAYAALERLYERGEQWGELVESLRQRLDAATEADERRRCLVKIARTLAEQLDDVPEAIVAWRTVFDEVGPERGTIRALAALYERANAWSDVADMLDAELSTVDDTEERLAILVRLGDTRRKHQGDLNGSLEAYRQALALDPSSVACRRAIEDMLEIPEARRAAAATLQPLYEADDDAAGLLRVLDVQISVAEDTAERLEFLRSALRTAEASLPDSDRAFAYAVRGTKESIAEPSISEWVDTFERLAVANARWTDAQALYLEIVEDVLDGDVQHELRIKLGEIARVRTNDASLAIVQFSKALSEREDDARALRALEELYTETGDAPKLLQILRRRVDAADTDADKRTLLFRVADIEQGKLRDPSAAIATYERVLDLGFDGEAAAALEPLYDAASRLSDLAALYERQIEAGAGRNADLRVKAARVAVRMDDASRAFDELAAALDAEPSHAGAVTILEDLLRGEALELRARAAAILEQVYLRRGEWANVKAALVARLAVAIDPAERREFLTRLATLHEEQLEDFAAALENVAELLHEDVADRGVWVELERLAKVAGAKEKLATIFSRELDAVTSDDEATADLCRKTAEIFAELGDAEAALRLYRRAHAFAPDSRDLFDAIDALLVASERHEERVALFRASMDARNDVERQRALHTIARLERDELRVPDRAIGTLREIVELDPTDDAALDALSELYRERVQHRDLADLLVRRAEGATSVQAAIEHRFALAEILKTHLDDASGAVDQLELIVSEVPTHDGATKLLEALAKEPVYKARVVEILRPLYEQSSDYQPLARLNEERLELANDPQDKIVILRETARLYEDRGSDPVRAFDAIRAAFEIDSDDGETRSELERLAAINGKYRDLAETLERGVERSMDNFAKRDLLASIARIYDSKLDSPRKSLDALTRLIDLDALDPEPLEAMDTLAVLLSDWGSLALVLEKKLEIASSDDQPALYRRLAETRLDLLSDEPGAIDAYENAHELQPENTIVIDALLGLYDGREHDKAADFYRKRIDLLSGDETDLRYDLNIRAAECFEVNLGDKREAIGCLMGALEARPSDATCLAKLERLFRAEEMWSDLLENLRQQAALVEDKSERTKLRLAIGDLELDRIENPADALASYRTVLEEQPTNTAAIAAVCRIAESYEDLRLEAVATVEPSLRDAERHAELVDVLKLRLDAQADGDAEDRLRTRRSIAVLLDEKLGRPAEAQVTLLLALDDAPEDASLHDDIESLSERVQGYARYADALATRADSDPAAALALTLRLGRLAEEKLADDALATTAYARALEIGGDSLDVLRALDRLYSKRGENYLLADILDRRAGLEVADYEQADVLTRLALIQYDQFDNPTEAISTLQRVIDCVLEHEGARAALEKIADRSDLFEEVAPILETVYRGRSDSAALAKLYGKRIGFADSADERVRMRLDLARVLEDKSGDPKTAQHALQAAFRDDPTNPDVFSEVERLAAMNSDWISAAVALESAASERDDLAEDVRRDLFVRAAEWRRDRADDAVGAEGALESALTCDPGSETLLKQLIDLQRAPGRERQLIGTTRRLAALDSTSREAAYELRRDAKALAQDVVGDPTLSEALVREMLEVDGDDAWALEELGSLREASGDYAEAFELLERRATLAASPTDATRLEHAAARMARRELGDAVRATEIYQRVFDRDLEDDVAAQALREIYAEQEDATSLVALLATLVERVRTVDERVALRLERAKLLIEKLESPGEAIVELSAILDEDRNATAIELLEGLFESTARYEELVGLLTSQSEEARGRGDTEAAVRYGLRLGDVAETKLGSVERALDAYRGVVDLEPRNHQALTSLARLYEDQGDRTEAASMLEQLLDASTSEAAAAFAMRLADLYASADDDSALRRVLERAVDLGPSPIEARAKLASVYERTGAWVDLSALLVHDATAAESVEQKVDLYRRAASIQSSQLNDPAAAADLLLKASEFGPDDRDLLLALCDAQSASGRSREAIEALQKIVDSYAGKRTKELASIHARIARAHRASGDDEKALAELDVAFKIDPASVSVLREIGLLSFELASTAPDEKAREVQLDRATKAFKSLLLQKLEADAPIGKGEVFYYLAEISVRQGDEKKALQMLERSLENAKDFAPAKELLARLKA